MRHVLQCASYLKCTASYVSFSFYKVGAWNLLVEADMIEVGKGHSYKHMDMQRTEGYESGAGK